MIMYPLHRTTLLPVRPPQGGLLSVSKTSLDTDQYLLDPTTLL